jgi:hypothetical protein
MKRGYAALYLQGAGIFLPGPYRPGRNNLKNFNQSVQALSKAGNGAGKDHQSQNQ